MGPRLLALYLLACDPASPCPVGTGLDPQRAARLAALVGLAEAGAVCFGPGVEASVEAAVDGRGRVRLDATWPDAAAAARLLHLRLHGDPHPAGAGCLEAALAEEGRAWQAELEARRRLGALDGPGSPPFVAEWGARPTPATIEAWLRAHPAGAPTVPASLERLAARCAEAPAPP